MTSRRRCGRWHWFCCSPSRSSGGCALRGFPLGVKSLLLLAPAVLSFLAGIDHTELPAMQGFNIAGGVQVVPELVALWAGLSIYGAAFIAEIVRAAILSVHKGQREAALSLGLRPRPGAVEGHSAAGAARDGAADHQPVPQHHQIQLARRGGGVSRAVRDLRRHGDDAVEPRDRNRSCC